MKAPLSLSFLPVSCVLTSANALTAEVRIFEINAENSSVTCSALAEQRYVLVLGSIVLVGRLSQSDCQMDSAAIVELPTGREKVTGSALWRCVKDDNYEVTFDGISETGVSLSMRLFCHVVETEQPVSELALVKAGIN
jgi:hypothetical protein